MQIHPLNTTHYSDWLPLWQGYLEFYETNLSQETTDVVFNRLCDTNKTNMGGFIAYDGNVALGFVHYIIHDGTWDTREVCYLEDLFVSHKARGKGIGRALIEQVTNHAKQNNLRNVYWMTHETNKTAQILYDKMADNDGFIVYKIKL